MAQVAKLFGSGSGASALDLDLSSPSPEGGAIYYHVQAATEAIAREISQSLGTAETFLDYVAPQISISRKQSVLRTTVAQDIYRPIMLGLVASRDHMVGTRSVVFVTLADLLPLFRRAALTWISDATFLNAPSLRRSVLVGAMRFFVSKVRDVAEGLRPWSQKRRLGMDGSRVAVQHAWGVGGNGELRDLWWLRKSDIDLSKILVFFHSTQLDRNSIEGSVEWLRSRGIPYVFLNTAPYRPKGERMVRPSLGGRQALSDIFLVLRMLFRRPGSRARSWQLRTFLALLVPLRRWQGFVRTEGIRVFFDPVETSLDAAAAAADLEDAVKVGVYWGAYLMPIARTSLAQQVRFAWGPRDFRLFAELGAAPELTVETGSHSSYIELPVGHNSTEVRKRNIQGASVRHVVTAFDLSGSQDNVCPAPYHVEFYNQLLDWVESDPGVALIVKPKKLSPAAFELDPNISHRIDRLVALDRAVILTEDHGPLEAALVSDLVVALGPNSAGVASAIAGVRTVFWDPARPLEGPFKSLFEQSGWRKGTVLFDEMDDLIGAAQGFFQGLKQWAELGDLSKFVPDFDPFLDGAAGERIGSFVRWFLEATDQGASRDVALQSAAEKYGGTWGADRVHWPLAASTGEPVEQNEPADRPLR